MYRLASENWEVYPHVCGGICVSTGKIRERFGLSPRVWGHPYGAAAARCGPGSIPTCVGASPICSDWEGRQRVYPHVCGGIEGV